MKSFYTFAMLVAAWTLFAAEKPQKIVFTGDSIAYGVGTSNQANRFATVAVKLLNQSAGREELKIPAS